MLASGNSWATVQQTLDCSRTTISKAVKLARQHTPAALPDTDTPTMQSVYVILRALIENNSKFVRGKKRVRKDIQYLAERELSGEKLDDCEYRLTIRYETEVDLKEQIDELFSEVYQLADLRNCTTNEVSIKHEITGVYWREYDGGWWE